MDEFSGKVVLITGAGQGLGRELALAFAAHGAIVAAQARAPINLDDTVAQIQAHGGQAQGFVADSASKLALQTLLNEISDQYGRLDILIQADRVDPHDLLLDMDEWDWRHTLDRNLTGPFLLMQSVGRIMRAQNSGVMINLICVDNATAAAMPGRMGLLALTQAFAAELGADNIRINAVSCGASTAEQLIGFPENPVELVLYLCRAESADINGRIVHFAHKP